MHMHTIRIVVLLSIYAVMVNSTFGYYIRSITLNQLLSTMLLNIKDRIGGRAVLSTPIELLGLSIQII